MKNLTSFDFSKLCRDYQIPIAVGDIVRVEMRGSRVYILINEKHKLTLEWDKLMKYKLISGPSIQ